jgi:pyruvate kinase
MTARAPTGRYAPERIASLIREVEALREGALALERAHADALEALPAAHRASARNLLHYLAVRQHDLRELQDRLAELGLSSLGRLEPHALASIDAVRAALHRLGGREAGAGDAPDAPDFGAGARLLAARTESLLGPVPKARRVRVMVTLPSEAAERPALVRDLLAAGMDVMRINCAHDDAGAWRRMVENARAAELELGRPCRVLCDLAGPKLRTGPIEPGPGVAHWWPLRDDAGRILAPARVRIAAEGGDAEGAETVLPIERELLRQLRAGDELRFTDVRGRRRALAVTSASGGEALAEADRNTYVASHAALVLHRDGAAVALGRVGALPPVEQVLRLDVGDVLLVTPESEAGRPAERDEAGRVVRPASIGCTLPDVFRDVRPGERILFDDGKIGGVVHEVAEGLLRVEITRARGGKAKLRGDRGINLPDTNLHLPALTPKDRADLDFVVEHADLVGLSFLRSPGDVDELLGELARRGGGRLGVVLKIETRRAFEQLPRLLLSALRSPMPGVMVARGDLGVELGFSRLAEVQEEILWLCEAAHVPVIWATQVLESLAKKGMPSRAEVTDAAMGGMAECVMLNKGAHVVEAVRFLSDVLVRMQGHHDKKRATLRKLGVSRLA